ncbi:MAG: GTP cyclohydrolase 1 [candidate division TA06 bacterium ADurb.Bin417]|uniref:GTP cyclohydrolase 1 n=1 Tax=candidate division TA06 bacterium ADurb.Bin417 TaxID=1852828 RepID=A0A1V5MEE1_UNCT6|nr:MAG: GTP cyclohydrolase 1 [candidate division TA06 bacterium ADurb.Bin417]
MIDKKKLEKATRLFLEGIGENPDRPELKETPRRVAEMAGELYSGLGRNPAELLKVVFSEEYDELVFVRDIPFYSTCEHHLLPFLGKAHIAYIPDSHRITGLSKLARVVETLSRRPQVQERLTTQVADTIMKTLRPRGVMVVIEAEHLCMTMRGVQKPGCQTVTSVMRGIFLEDARTRNEALNLLHRDRVG